MIIITKDNISNYLTDHDINIIDININKKMLFCGLNIFIFNKFGEFLLCNKKYYYITYNNGCCYKIIIINNNNYNDIKIYIQYKNYDKICYYIIKNISIVYIYQNNNINIDYNYTNKSIEYYLNYNNNYKLIEIGTKTKKIFLDYKINYYYIYYSSDYYNYYSLYYYYNYFLFIMKICKYKFNIKRNIIHKLNLNNIINLLFFVYINLIILFKFNL